MRIVAAALAAALSLLAPQIAFSSEAYPDKPLKIVVPLAPGGTTDILSRYLAQELHKNLGVPVIVENKPGANNIIGTQALAAAPGDGYTMGMLISTHTINPHIAKSLPYDSHKDFIPLALIAKMPGLMTVNPDVPAKTLQELVALAKAEPGTLAYGQPGGLSSGHLSMEYLKKVAGIDILSVPYKGGGPAVVDLAAGHIQVLINSPTSTLPFVRDGKVRAIATTGAKRPAALAEIPTIAESGFPEFELYEWYGLFFPAGTPQEIVDRMNSEIVKIMATPEMARRIEEIGAESSTYTAAQFAEFVGAEDERWGNLIKQLGMKPE
ncbi:tripartite tricarboxylate transporter substrate binding protein [Bordetella sp. BOR01]|nr:tripartite tricarboxylate transporter substrate binding protein [Bordetella sp. BOR01]MBV7481675.1 tripartite tricarboxylate transporter substrate binding protein [Bordetella sp. BOR01]